ncbi:ribonuclease BN [Wohlfahrtiimonas chitiniclastica]|uniref:ribonuclease Z n=1 Tax=Wohlfahrtiimonas chitiniclastica TaxID=400946 RepID=UPI000B994B6F|nr:ribonuclease Z [Wohlfahrtiimonas chitiniclastica]OYQ89123.1 ribonuclease BN [Wohlfahrtiimonas chitiniclastica]
MNLTFLGTGAGRPSLQRNVTSMVLDLTQERHEMWLFDCGEATGHQIQRLQQQESKNNVQLPGITLPKISKIFITHLHGDHIFGLFGFLTSRSMSGCQKPLTLYGPKGIRKILETVIEISESFMLFPFEIVELTPNSDPSQPFTVFEDDTITVTAIELQHRVQSFAYRIEEHHLHRDGKTVVIFGDTYPCDNAITIAKGADFMVHETTYAAEFEELALQRAHSTTVQTATTAHTANVGKLYMTHISSRYYNQALQQQLIDECRSIFPNSHLAHDLLRVEI